MGWALVSEKKSILDCRRSEMEVLENKEKKCEATLQTKKENLEKALEGAKYFA